MKQRWNGEALYNQKRRLIRKRQAIEYLGGKCKDCGNIDDRTLEFEHAHEPRNGRKTISAYLSGSWERLKTRINEEKIELVCANCHAIRTWERTKLGD